MSSAHPEGRRLGQVVEELVSQRREGWVVAFGGRVALAYCQFCLVELDLAFVVVDLELGPGCLLDLEDGSLLGDPSTDLGLEGSEHVEFRGLHGCGWCKRW